MLSHKIYPPSLVSLAPIRQARILRLCKVKELIQGYRLSERVIFQIHGPAKWVLWTLLSFCIIHMACPATGRFSRKVATQFFLNGRYLGMKNRHPYCWQHLRQCIEPSSFNDYLLNQWSGIKVQYFKVSFHVHKPRSSNFP